jgi:hypothetical protein
VPRKSTNPSQNAAVLADLVDAHELAMGPLPAHRSQKSVREKRRMVAISSVATESFEAAQGLSQIEAMSTTRLEVRRVGGSCWCS